MPLKLNPLLYLFLSVTKPNGDREKVTIKEKRRAEKVAIKKVKGEERKERGEEREQVK